MVYKNPDIAILLKKRLNMGRLFFGFKK